MLRAFTFIVDDMCCLLLCSTAIHIFLSITPQQGSKSLLSQFFSMQAEDEALPVKQFPINTVPPTTPHRQPGTPATESKTPKRLTSSPYTPKHLFYHGQLHLVTESPLDKQPLSKIKPSPLAACPQNTPSPYGQKPPLSPGGLSCSRKSPSPVVLPPGSGPWAEVDLAEQQPFTPAAAAAAVLHSDSVLNMPEGPVHYHQSPAAVLDPFGGHHRSSSSSRSTFPGHSQQTPDSVSSRSPNAASTPSGQASVAGQAHMVPFAAATPPLASAADVIPYDKAAKGNTSSQKQGGVIPGGAATSPDHAASGTSSSKRAPDVRGIAKRFFNRATGTTASTAAKATSTTRSSSNDKTPARSAAVVLKEGGPATKTSSSSTVIGVQLPLCMLPANTDAKGMGSCSGSCFASVVKAHPRLMHVMSVQLKVGRAYGFMPASDYGLCLKVSVGSRHCIHAWSPGLQCVSASSSVKLLSMPHCNATCGSACLLQKHTRCFYVSGGAKRGHFAVVMLHECMFAGLASLPKLSAQW